MQSVGYVGVVKACVEDMMTVMIGNTDDKTDYIRLEFFSHSEGDGAGSMSDQLQARTRFECALAFFSHSDGEGATAKSNRIEGSSICERLARTLTFFSAGICAGNTVSVDVLATLGL